MIDFIHNYTTPYPQTYPQKTSAYSHQQNPKLNQSLSDTKHQKHYCNNKFFYFYTGLGSISAFCTYQQGL